MMSTVNSQIVDSVSDVVTLTGGIAPAQAFGMLDTVMVETLGMAMYNAVNRQQGASMIGSAAVTAACAKMINANLPTPGIVPPLPPRAAPCRSAARAAAVAHRGLRPGRLRPLRARKARSTR
jgi:hypothetical protein